jgi:hypothetical protein
LILTPRCCLIASTYGLSEPTDSHFDSHVGRSRWTRTKLVDVTTETDYAVAKVRMAHPRTP